MHICFQLIEQHFQRYVFPKVGKIKPRADLVLLLKISACQISALNELSSDTSVAARSNALPDYSSTLESSYFCFRPFLFPLILRQNVKIKKLFIVALSFAYFSKALTGTYMKSSITQIERRFDLSSTHIGLIDGSFEMGNLLFLAVVSHFGAKLHRPRLIAAGCFLMAVGAFLTGLTHFFMGRYRGSMQYLVYNFDAVRATVCELFVTKSLSQISSLCHYAACVRDSGSSMWIYVFLGNALRGIGETPVTPLGISYIDDFAKAENSPFYIACLQTITLLGPMFGFLLGSYCARLYVDIGYVDMESVTITPKDSRWVGAWWMGFLVSSGLLLISSIPFWFLPRSMPKQESEENHETPVCEILNKTEDAQSNNQNFKLTEIAKGFLPSLRRLLGTPAYFLLLCGSILKFNAFIGLLTFKAKYMEQQFGQSASRANFLIAEEWDPVCSDSGITYISPCMAGCLSSSGHGKNTVFHNCTCVSTSFPAGSSTSVRLGQCPHAKDCSRSFTSYMAISVLSSFINALGATPGYMVIIRCITPELKSLALGIQTLVTRTLGGIPAPVYFGALIDSTCLKWSMKSCGGRGACRIYNSDMYRYPTEKFQFTLFKQICQKLLTSIIIVVKTFADLPQSNSVLYF
uniref:Solute carrier organic anion transporter family member n=1 Tax=Haplochromis burtoni TaxID=8153 RepID=A0A3Q2X3E1_HAPBU